MTPSGPQEVLSPTVFHSILFERADAGFAKAPAEAPPLVRDLNLDQIVDAITAGKQDYNLQPFFFAPLNDLGAITYRHEVFRDLERQGSLLESLDSFARRMREMRDHLAQAAKLYYKYQKESWFLDAVGVYCDAVNRLIDDLGSADLRSRGLSAFHAYVKHYAASARFTSLVAATSRLKADLAAVQYRLLIDGHAITVSRYDSQADFSTAVEDTFRKFQRGAVKDYRVKFSDGPDMNHVEAQILDRVARWYPELFSRLETYCETNVTYLDDTIATFDREIQFYLAYLEYMAMFLRAGLTFCYPRLSSRSKNVYDYEAFDLALARRLISEHSPVVTNDFYLEGSERIFVVSGPNQGGKTTFARTFGQLHYLAGLGCPVPGRDAQLFLFDRLFTHFEREEHIQDLRGKLEDDLVRIRDILQQATPDSSIIINEIFTSTTPRDAVFLGTRLVERLVRLDALCVYVTFVVELASLSDKTVSMVSTIVPDNPTMRTYKIERRPADGLAYAISIAEKYRLTYAALKERIPR